MVTMHDVIGAPWVYGNCKDETDLSFKKKLEKLYKKLQALSKEKSDHLKQVLDHLSTLNSLCLVIGKDFQQTVNEIYSSLGDYDGRKNINDVAIKQLATAIQTP